MHMAIPAFPFSIWVSFRFPDDSKDPPIAEIPKLVWEYNLSRETDMKRIKSLPTAMMPVMALMIALMTMAFGIVPANAASDSRTMPPLAFKVNGAIDVSRTSTETKSTIYATLLGNRLSTTNSNVLNLQATSEYAYMKASNGEVYNGLFDPTFTRPCGGNLTVNIKLFVSYQYDLKYKTTETYRDYRYPDTAELANLKRQGWTQAHTVARTGWIVYKDKTRTVPRIMYGKTGTVTFTTQTTVPGRPRTVNFKMSVSSTDGTSASNVVQVNLVSSGGSNVTPGGRALSEKVSNGLPTPGSWSKSLYASSGDVHHRMSASIVNDDYIHVSGPMSADFTASRSASVQVRQKKYTVDFDANVSGARNTRWGGGASGSTPSITVKSTDSFSLPGCGFKRDKYDFKGWSLHGGDDKATYADGEHITKQLNTQPTSGGGAKKVDGEHITLYAQWEPFTKIHLSLYCDHDITVNDNRGTGGLYSVAHYEAGARKPIPGTDEQSHTVTLPEGQVKQHFDALDDGWYNLTGARYEVRGKERGDSDQSVTISGATDSSRNDALSSNGKSRYTGEYESQIATQEIWVHTGTGMGTKGTNYTLRQTLSPRRSASDASHDSGYYDSSEVISYFAAVGGGKSNWEPYINQTEYPRTGQIRVYRRSSRPNKTIGNPYYDLTKAQYSVAQNWDDKDGKSSKNPSDASPSNDMLGLDVTRLDLATDGAASDGSCYTQYARYLAFGDYDVSETLYSRGYEPDIESDGAHKHFNVRIEPDSARTARDAFMSVGEVRDYDMSGDHDGYVWDAMGTSDDRVAAIRDRNGKKTLEAVAKGSAVITVRRHSASDAAKDDTLTWNVTVIESTGAGRVEGTPSSATVTFAPRPYLINLRADVLSDDPDYTADYEGKANGEYDLTGVAYRVRGIGYRTTYGATSMPQFTNGHGDPVYTDTQESHYQNSERDECRLDGYNDQEDLRKASYAKTGLMPDSSRSTQKIYNNVNGLDVRQRKAVVQWDGLPLGMYYIDQLGDGGDGYEPDTQTYTIVASSDESWTVRDHDPNMKNPYVKVGGEDSGTKHDEQPDTNAHRGYITDDGVLLDKRHYCVIRSYNSPESVELTIDADSNVIDSSRGKADGSNKTPNQEHPETGDAWYGIYRRDGDSATGDPNALVGIVKHGESPADEYVADAGTVENGKVKGNVEFKMMSKVPYGNWFIRMLTPPVDCELDTKWYPVTISREGASGDADSGQGKKPLVVPEIQIAKGRLTVRRRSTDPITTETNANYTLNGATYGVYFSKGQADDAAEGVRQFRLESESPDDKGDAQMVSPTGGYRKTSSDGNTVSRSDLVTPPSRYTDASGKAHVIADPSQKIPYKVLTSLTAATPGKSNATVTEIGTQVGANRYKSNATMRFDVDGEDSTGDDMLSVGNWYLTELRPSLGYDGADDVTVKEVRVMQDADEKKVMDGKGGTVSTTKAEDVDTTVGRPASDEQASDVSPTQALANSIGTHLKTTGDNGKEIDIPVVSGTRPLEQDFEKYSKYGESVPAAAKAKAEEILESVRTLPSDDGHIIAEIGGYRFTTTTYDFDADAAGQVAYNGLALENHDGHIYEVPILISKNKTAVKMQKIRWTDNEHAFDEDGGFENQWYYFDDDGGTIKDQEGATWYVSSPKVGVPADQMRQIDLSGKSKPEFLPNTHANADVVYIESDADDGSLGITHEEAARRLLAMAKGYGREIRSEKGDGIDDSIDRGNANAGRICFDVVPRAFPIYIRYNMSRASELTEKDIVEAKFPGPLKKYPGNGEGNYFHSEPETSLMTGFANAKPLEWPVNDSEHGTVTSADGRTLFENLWYNVWDNHRSYQAAVASTTRPDGSKAADGVQYGALVIRDYPMVYVPRSQSEVLNEAAEKSGRDIKWREANTSNHEYVWRCYALRSLSLIDASPEDAASVESSETVPTKEADGASGLGSSLLTFNDPLLKRTNAAFDIGYAIDAIKAGHGGIYPNYRDVEADPGFWPQGTNRKGIANFTGYVVEDVPNPLAIDERQLRLIPIGADGSGTEEAKRLVAENAEGKGTRHEIHAVTIKDDAIMIYENYEEIKSEGVQAQTSAGTEG